MAGIDQYTKLLLHADGSGASFVDSSLSGHVITANGNATQSATQSKFGGKSLYLDGTGDYLSIPTSSDFDLGADNFTIDFWSYNILGLYGAILQFGNSSYDNVIIGRYDSAGTLNVFLPKVGGGYVLWAFPIAGYVESDVRWRHHALTRNGDTFKSYENGVLIATGTGTGTIAYPAQSLFIGRYYDNTAYYLSGYIEELRISKGIVRWTSDFTPPTTEYGYDTISGIFSSGGISTAQANGNGIISVAFSSNGISTAQANGNSGKKYKPICDYSGVLKELSNTDWIDHSNKWSLDVNNDLQPLDTVIPDTYFELDNNNDIMATMVN